MRRLGLSVAVALAVAPAARAESKGDRAPVGAALAEKSARVKEAVYEGDPRIGWDLFRRKNCIRCHAVWGEGADVAPDLGRARTLQHLTAGELAGMMWNHVPRMWEKMEEGRVQFTPISADEMNHLFAFLLFIRYADEPGDAAEGERALARLHCTTCHSVAAAGGTVGPDLERWARFVNPVVWAQQMWRHAPGMRDVMARMNVAWPRFLADDLVNIVAYVRSRAAGEQKEYIAPGSPARGRDLFAERGCAACHGPGAKGRGPDLERADLPDSLGGIAAEMWNHALAMMRASGRPPELDAQQMADIIAYLLTRRYFLAEGDAQAGRQVFLKKQCVGCHAVGKLGGTVGPALTPVRGSASPVLMGHIMWQHGPKMLDEMARLGVPWPSFSTGEMTDLIAFLNQGDQP